MTSGRPSPPAGTRRGSACGPGGKWHGSTGVALMTMQRALSALADEGYLALYRSRGAFVRSPESADGEDARPTLDGLAQEVRELRQTVQALEGRLSRLERPRRGRSGA
jgi:DNA-binding GntR family transcriptional regulator